MKSRSIRCRRAGAVGEDGDRTWMLPRGTASNGMSTNIGGKRAGENVGGVSRAPLGETGDDGADESDMETSDGMESVRSRCRASALGLRLVRPRLPTEFILKT